MDIQPALSSGVQGIKVAEEIATQAATSIAEHTLSTELANEQDAAARPDSVDPANLTEAVVNLKVAEFQNSASAEVVKTADESLGTLLDVRV